VCKVKKISLGKPLQIRNYNPLKVPTLLNMADLSTFLPVGIVLGLNNIPE
jgi:hypothetical protein